MAKEKPPWLEEVREFCRSAGIKIMAWGPDMLTVEAKSPDRAMEIAAQLGQLGFKGIKDEDDAYAGMLSLSRDPAAIQAKIASFDVSRRRWDEQIEPLIWALGSLLLVPHINTGYPQAFTMPLGVLSLALFFWDGSRIWGWRLELPPQGPRVRRYFRWSMIPWEEISAVESNHAVWGRNQETVVLKLASRRLERLGTFGFAFARNLRDRLRYELAQTRRDTQ